MMGATIVLQTFFLIPDLMDCDRDAAIGPFVLAELPSNSMQLES